MCRDVVCVPPRPAVSDTAQTEVISDGPVTRLRPAQPPGCAEGWYPRRRTTSTRPAKPLRQRGQGGRDPPDEKNRQKFGQAGSTPPSRSGRPKLRAGRAIAALAALTTDSMSISVPTRPAPATCNARRATRATATRECATCDPRHATRAICDPRTATRDLQRATTPFSPREATPRALPQQSHRRVPAGK